VQVKLAPCTVTVVPSACAGTIRWHSFLRGARPGPQLWGVLLWPWFLQASFPLLCQQRLVEWPQPNSTAPGSCRWRYTKPPARPDADPRQQLTHVVQAAGLGGRQQGWVRAQVWRQQQGGRGNPVPRGTPGQHVAQQRRPVLGNGPGGRRLPPAGQPGWAPGRGRRRRLRRPRGAQRPVGGHPPQTRPQPAGVGGQACCRGGGARFKVWFKVGAGCVQGVLMVRGVWGPCLSPYPAKATLASHRHTLREHPSPTLLAAATTPNRHAFRHTCTSCTSTTSTPSPARPPQSHLHRPCTAPAAAAHANAPRPLPSLAGRSSAPCSSHGPSIPLNGRHQVGSCGAVPSPRRPHQGGPPIAVWGQDRGGGGGLTDQQLHHIRAGVAGAGGQGRQQGARGPHQDPGHRGALLAPVAWQGAAHPVRGEVALKLEVVREQGAGHRRGSPGCRGMGGQKVGGAPMDVVHDVECLGCEGLGPSRLGPPQTRRIGRRPAAPERGLPQCRSGSSCSLHTHGPCGRVSGGGNAAIMRDIVYCQAAWASVARRAAAAA
jgi:hypothetical protein